MQVLKRRWSTFRHMLTCSGVWWDTKSNMVWAFKAQWLEWKRDYPLSVAYTVQGDPLYDDLCSLFAPELDLNAMDGDEPNPPAEDAPIQAAEGNNDGSNFPQVELIVLSSDDDEAPVEYNVVIVLSDNDVQAKDQRAVMLEPLDGFGIEPVLNYDAYNSEMDFGMSEEDKTPVHSPNQNNAPGEVINDDKDITVAEPSSARFADVIPQWIPPSPAGYHFS